MERIIARRNADYPDSYPWPWTAYLQEQDSDGQWRELDAADGDHEGEARDLLLQQNARARRV